MYNNYTILPYGSQVAKIKEKLAEKKNTDIELLFHPGYANRGENVMDKEKKGFNKFYFSQGRRIEFEALKEIKLQN